jgi:predicted TIM-barrel fold metal-dependent hydrolase
MQTSLSGIPVIDVDTHYSEPPDLWTSRAPRKLVDRAPRVVRTPAGVDQWVVDGKHVFGPLGFCVIRKDASKKYGTLCLDTYEELHLGASQAKPRLTFMDEHGLSVQILYPNILGFAGNAIMRLEDLELRNFCVTAYNDGIAQLQAEGEGRLYPQFLLPFWDIDLTVRELVRCSEKLGLTGFVVSDAPETWGLPTLSEAYWDPLWAAAQERGLPVNFHIGGGGSGGVSIWGGVPKVQSSDSPGAFLSSGAKIATASVQAFMANIRCVTNLIFSGLLDRFPRLNFVSVESGVGWLPFHLDLCEYQFDESGVTSLELRPKEYFRRQIYASYWFEHDPRYTIEQLGPDNIMFETDFPHPTCLYPGIREHMQATLGSLDPSVQRKVLFENAQRVYHIPLPS